MKIGIIIQARMGSKRLPGKVLMHVDGVPLLIFLYKRLESLREKYKIFVATTQNKSDTQLVNLCDEYKIPSFCGSEEDVLDRYFQLSKFEKLDLIIRVNADCPFLDAEFVDDKVQKFLNLLGKIDYGSTILKPSFPIGMHLEIFTFDALASAHQECTDPLLREHVTPYIYQNPHKYKLMSFQNDENLSRVRLTIDYNEDLLFTNELIKSLRDAGKKITLNNIIDTITRSEKLRKINQHIYKPQKIH